MLSSPLKHWYAGRLDQFSITLVTVNPSCAYTVCRSTRGRQKLKLGLCIKKGTNKGLNLELFWILVLQLARHGHVEYFFKEVYVEIRKPWLPCYLRLTDTVWVLWLTLFSRSWSTMRCRQGGKKMLQLLYHNGSVACWSYPPATASYKTCICWFFHWPSSTGPSLHCVVFSMLSCKTCETEQHYYNLHWL